jgi:hypothetical protein
MWYILVVGFWLLQERSDRLVLHRHLYLQVWVGELLNIRPVSENLELMGESWVRARFQRWQAGRDFGQ